MSSVLQNFDKLSETGEKCWVHQRGIEIQAGNRQVSEFSERTWAPPALTQALAEEGLGWAGLLSHREIIRL